MQPLRCLSAAFVSATLVFVSACGGADEGSTGVAFLGKPISAWNAALESPDRHDRLAAVRAVGEMARRNPQNTDAMESLRRALSHDDRAVRHWAVRSVGAMGKAASSLRDDLRVRLADEETDVRVWAAHALCRIGGTEEALPVLAEALSDTNGGARLHAAHALEALGDDARPVVDALRGVLGDEFGYPDRVAGRFLNDLGEYPQDAAQD